MSWSKMKKAKEESGSGLFVQLKDGEELVGVFVGEPRCYYYDFQSKREEAEYFPGSQFKFKIPFVVKENGTFVAKIFNSGSDSRDQLVDLIEEHGQDCLYKIKGKSEYAKGLNRNYIKPIIFYKGPVDPEMLAQAHAVKLPPLESTGKAENEQAREQKEYEEKVVGFDERNPPPPDDDDIPF
jgi:hypothetical protein